MESSKQLHFTNQTQAELQNELYVEQKRRHLPYYCNLDRMMSGGQIPWNAIAICEMTKTSWQTGKLKMKEDLENPSGTCFGRGVNSGRRYSDCWDWRIGKVRCIRNITHRWPNAKEVLRYTQKDGEFVFPVADGSAKLSGRDDEFQEPTLRRESTVKRENLNGASHGDREEFQPEETKDDEGITKDFRAHAEARKEFHSSSSYWTERFNLRTERRIIPYFTRFALLNETPPRRKKRCGGRNGEKLKHLRQKQIQMYIDIAGKGRKFSTLLQLYARIRSDGKISRKLFT